MVYDTMVFSLEGTPLGLVDVQCWARDGAEFGKKHQRKQRRIEEKESYRWVETLREISQLSVSQRNSMVVTVADRECDIYEFLLEAQLRNAKYVIRAAHNRHILESEYKYTYAYVRARPVRGQMEVTVPREQRTAAVKVRFSAITLCAPERLTKSKNQFNVSCWVIHVEEVEPPAGVEA